MWFAVDKQINGEWQVVVEEVHVRPPNGAERAIMKVRHGAGIYRVRSLDAPDSTPTVFDVPEYGIAKKVGL